MSTELIIAGEMGKGGGGSVEYKDTLISEQTVKTLFAVGEGIIEGIEDIYLDTIGIANFDAEWEVRQGTDPQTTIKGFTVTETSLPGFTSKNIIRDSINKNGEELPNISTGQNFAATNLVVGDWYRIVSVGSTLWTLIGASKAVAGNVFQATAVGTGTGTAVKMQPTFVLPTFAALIPYEENLTSVRLTFSFSAMTYMDSAGNMKGSSVTFEIYSRASSNDTWRLVENKTVKGKTTHGYTFDRTVARPATATSASHWEVKVIRITPDSGSSKKQNTMTWSAVTQLYDKALPYNKTALVGVILKDATQFGNRIPEIMFRVKGKKLRLPTNYDPVTRTYNTLVWDGTIRSSYLQYSNNPAWILYDVLTDVTSGLGIPEADIDKYSFYNLGRYADEPLANGYSIPVICQDNGEVIEEGYPLTIPRFTLDYSFQTREGVKDFLSQILSICNANLITNEFGQLAIIFQRPGQVVKRIVNNANVIDGVFTYQSSNIEQRTNLVNVTYNRGLNFGRTDTATVSDDSLITRYGLRPLDVVLPGCYHETQAIRKARWVLYTNCYFTDFVTFSVALDGMSYKIGDLIRVCDNYNRTDQQAGIVLSSTITENSTTITLDRAVVVTEGTYTFFCYDSSDVEITKTITAPFNSATITLSEVRTITKGSIFAVSSSAVDKLYRVTSISKDEDQIYSVTALEFDEAIFDYVDSGINLEPKTGDFADVGQFNTLPVTSLAVSENFGTNGSYNSGRLSVSWLWDVAKTQKFRANFKLTWAVDNGVPTVVNTISSDTYDIMNPIPGIYSISVWAVNSFTNIYSRVTTLEYPFRTGVDFVIPAGTIEHPDYDYAGYVAKYGVPVGGLNLLNDEFKLPSHITFDTDSIYSVGIYQGGVWEGSDTTNVWQFYPSEYNLSQYSEATYQDYFENTQLVGTSVRVNGNIYYGTIISGEPSNPTPLYTPKRFAGGSAVVGARSTLKPPVNVRISGTLGAAVQPTTLEFSTPELSLNFDYNPLNQDVEDALHDYVVQIWSADSWSKMETYTVTPVIGVDAIDPIDVSLKYKPLNGVFAFPFSRNVNVFNGVPARTFIVKIYSRDTLGDLSLPILLTVTNPVPDFTDFTVTPDFGAVRIVVDVSGEVDVKDYFVWRGIVADFTPTEDNLVYKGPSNVVTITTLDTDEYFYKCAISDSFGSEGLTYSTAKAAKSIIGGADFVLISGEQFFTYASGSTTPRNSSITLTANLYGNLSTYLWKYWDGTTWSNLSGVINQFTYNLTFDNEAWGTEKTLRVSCFSGELNGEITIGKISDGTSASSTTIVPIYRRVAGPNPSLPLPSGVTTYNFTSGTLTGLDNGWAKDVPAGTDPLYMSAATAIGVGTDTILTSEWATPVLFVSNGVNGTPGTNTATVTLYQTTATSTPPVVPNIPLTYKFSDATIAETLPNNWQRSLPTTGAYRWITTATALGTGDTDVIQPSEWAPTSLLAQDGINGLRTAILDMYQWAASPPTLFPSGSSTFTWSTGQFTAPPTTNNWYLTPQAPVKGQTLYVARTIYTDSLTAATTAINWTATTSTARGIAGIDGTPGTRTAYLEVYKWSANAPTTFPQGTSTYTWANGTFTDANVNTNGWLLVPGTPVQGQTLWGISQTYTDTGSSLSSPVTWSSISPYPLGYSGIDGQPGKTASTFGINNAAAVFNKNATNVISPSAGITLTTSYQNITGTLSYQWQKNGTNITGATSSSYTVSTSDYSSVTTNTYKVTITGTINGVFGSLTDTITIPMLVDGGSGPVVLLSNENITFGAPNVLYSGIDFSNGTCDVTAYIGSTQLTYAASGANTFSLTYSSSSVTVGAGSNPTSQILRIPAPTGMSAESATNTITITLRDASGTALPLVVKYLRYNLSRAGSVGMSYWLSNTDYLKRSTSLVYSPAAITLNGYSAAGSTTPAAYPCRFKIYEDGSATASYTSPYDEASKSYTPSTTAVSYIKVEMYLAGGTTTLVDYSTIPVVQDGSQGITLVEPNSAVLLPADSAGNVSSYSGSGTTIKVFEGSNQLTFTTGVVTKGYFGVSAAVSTGTVTVGGISGAYTTTCTIGNHSGLSTDLANITYTVSIVKADGTSVVLTDVQTLTKSKAGAKGDLTPMVIVNGEQAFKYAADTTIPTNQTITLSASLSGGLTSYSWEYWYANLVWLPLPTPNTSSTYSLAYNNAAFGTANSLRIRCLSSTAYDEITVVKLYDGAKGKDAITGYLTNESAALPADSSGTVSSYTGASGNFKVFNGTTDVTTSNCAYSVVAPNPASGVTITIGSTTGAYTASGTMNADAVSFTLNAVYSGVTPSVTVSKVLSLTRAKAGIAGVTTTTTIVADTVTVAGEQAFNYAADATIPGTTSITLTAVLTGALTTYAWEYWNGFSWSSFSSTSSTFTLAYNNAAFTGNSLRVRCLSGTKFDEVTIVKLYSGTNGKDSVVGYLTNETATFPADKDGVVSDYSVGNGQFKVFSGTKDITSGYSTTYSVTTATVSGLTLAINTAGAYTLSVSNSSLANAASSFTFEVKAVTSSTYGSVTVVKSIKYAKSKTGATGVGTSGKAAVRAYQVTSSAGTAPSYTASTINGTLPSVIFPVSTWSATQGTVDVNQFQWQIDGIADYVTGTTSWTNPYLSVFKVDTLAAFTVKTGKLLSRPANNGGAVMTINSTPDGITETNEFRSYNGVSVVTSFGDGLITGQNSVVTYDSGAASSYNLNREALAYLNSYNASNSSNRFIIGINHTHAKYGVNGNLRQYAGGQTLRSATTGSDGALTIDIGYAKKLTTTVGAAEVMLGGRFCTNMYSGSLNRRHAYFAGDFSNLATDSDVSNHLPALFGGSNIFTTARGTSLAGKRFAGAFADDSTSVVICDGTYAINVSRGDIKSVGNISVGGNITAYDGSDRRIKDNIVPITDALGKVSKLSGNTFKWASTYYDKQDKELFKEYDVGVIAQEVQEVLPEAVHERADGVLAVNYVKLIPLLIEAIKEQQKQIEELKNDIARIS